MKMFILFLLSILLTSTSYGQLHISCDYREVCLYNEKTEKFDICKKYRESSLFEINENETMFQHTTPEGESAYYIKSKEKLESGIWMISVTSDVGNKYVYFLDMEHNELRVAAKADGKLIMIRFYIKNTWLNQSR